MYDNLINCFEEGFPFFNSLISFEQGYYHSVEFQKCE